MSFEAARHLTGILLALAFAQSSPEHLICDTKARVVFALRLICCAFLLAGIGTLPALGVLWLTALYLLHLFQGPYNGGSDKMGVLILTCLLLSHLAPSAFWQHMAFAWLAVQLTLSYFVSGQVKLVNSEWRSGRALTDVFAFSAYPVSENLRGLATHTRLMQIMSWNVIGFEVLFPLALLSAPTLWIALGVAALFHLANACLFGLNRFLWIWLAAWPSLLWLQERVFG